MHIYRSESFISPPTTMFLPEVKRSRNQHATNELYYNPPITLPDVHQPILPQFNSFLSRPLPRVAFGTPTYGGPYERLGTTTDESVVEMKEYLSELPPTISFEARAVFLTTLLNKYDPFVLSRQQHLPPLYDIGRDRHLAHDIYGGNGLYQAAEEWIALAKGRYPEVRKKVKLPWIAMHIRHTFLKNPHLIETYSSIQTAIDMLFFFQRHYRKPNEEDDVYIDRMSHPYWMAHEDLRKLNLLPGYKRVPAIRYV